MINLSSQSHLTRKREKVSNIAYFNTVIQHHAIRHAHPKEKWHSKSHRSNLVPSIAVGKMGGRGGREEEWTIPFHRCHDSSSFNASVAGGLPLVHELRRPRTLICSRVAIDSRPIERDQESLLTTHLSVIKRPTLIWFAPSGRDS